MRDIPFGLTQISPEQIKLRRLFSVQRILAARGFRVTSERTFADTLLGRGPQNRKELELLFDVFRKPATRKELLGWVESSATPSSAEVKALITLPGFLSDRQRYSTTFEWFVGELMIQEFMAFSSSFGVTVQGIVRNSDAETAGDFDVLSVLGDMNLLYLECKTGKCRRQSILNSVERSLALHSVGCVVLVDSAVAFSDVRQQLRSVPHPRFGHPGSLSQIAITGAPNSDILQWFDCYFVAGGEAGGELEPKLRTVMRVLAAHRSSVFEEIKPNPEAYKSMGYNHYEEQL